MPQAVIFVIAAVLAVVCLVGPIRWSAAALISALLLVPDTLGVPDALHSLTLLRVAILATTAGLLLRAARGEIPWGVLRPTRAQVVLLAYVAYAYFAGVAGQGYPGLFSPSLNVWFTTVDQLLFFGCAVAVVRLLGGRWVAGCVVVVASIAALIAVGEWATGQSYARVWLEHVAGVGSTGPGGVLERRGDSVRVRSAAEFALEFAWVSAALLPLAVAVAAIAKRRIAWAVPAVLLFAIVETFSRSAFVGIAVGFVILVGLTRFDRRVVAALIVAATAGLVLYTAVPALREPFKAASSTDSVSSRERRLESVTATVTHPLTGEGFDGTAARGVTSTDDSFLSAYAAVGAIGLLLLFGATFVAVVDGSAAAWRSPGRDRLIAAAATGGVAVGVASAAAFDSLVVPGSALAVWLLAAVAVAGVPSRVGSPQRLSAARLLVPAVGLSAGLVVYYLAATGTAVTSELNVISGAQIDVPYSSESIGTTLVTAVCTAGDAAATGAGGVSAKCQPDGVGPGTATLRLAAGDPGRVATAAQAFDEAATRVATPYRRMVVLVTRGRPAPARVAPVVGALVGLGAAVLVPARRRPRGTRATTERRSPPTEPPPSPLPTSSVRAAVTDS